MEKATGDYVSWIHQTTARESGVSWWGERSGWVRHLVYWMIAALLVAITVVDDSAIAADEGRNYKGAAVIAWFLGTIIVAGAIAILREASCLPAWRTLSRLAVTTATLIGALTLLLVGVRAKIEPAEGDATPRLIAEYLAWHVADAVPALDVPQAFGWDRPATSAGAFVGIAVVLVRAYVFFIVLVSVKKLWDRVMIDRPPATRRELAEASRLLRNR